MSRYFLAIDIGASSGRHILGSVENGCPMSRTRCPQAVLHIHGFSSE